MGLRARLRQPRVRAVPRQLLLKIDEIDGDEAAKAVRKSLVGGVNGSIDRYGSRRPQQLRDHVFSGRRRAACENHRGWAGGRLR